MHLSGRTIAVVLMAFTAAGASPAFAHSDNAHDKKTGPVVKEQKDWGIAGDAEDATRTIEIKMFDSMHFSPGKIDVKQGETLRFVVKNDGALMHEFVIGTKKENDAHADMMVKHPGMEHDEPYMAHVAPGKTGEIVWTFNRPGDFDFACLIAGHYQAGMVGKIKVAGTGAARADGDRVVSQAAPPAATAADMADGEIRKVDKGGSKLTIKHGELRNLDMPPMTMVFQVRDPALLDKVKAGDRVRFKAEKAGSTFIVTELEAAR